MQSLKHQELNSDISKIQQDIQKIIQMRDENKK